MSTDKSWHLSKTVPVTLIFALLMQTAAAIWWAGGVNNRVESLEKKLTSIDTGLEQENLRQWARIDSVESLASRVETQSRVSTAILERLENQVTDLRDGIKETNRLLRESLGGNP